MEWYVLNYNLNKRKLEYYNIFNNVRFSEGIEDILNTLRLYPDRWYEDFKEAVKIKLMSAFWCRREYELSIGDAFDDDLDNYEKIDIYSQVLPNLDHLCNYILNEALSL